MRVFTIVEDGKREKRVDRSDLCLYNMSIFMSVKLDNDLGLYTFQ